MPRTIRTKVYKFKELSKEAKQVAIEQYRNSGSVDVQYTYDEAHETVKEFHKLFNTREGNRSWLDVRIFDTIDGNILELKGLRLRTWLINNFYSTLYSGKYRNVRASDKGLKHKRIKSTYYKQTDRWHNSWESAIFFEHSCELTGVCYDEILLDPIYKFIDNYTEVNQADRTGFEDLVREGFENLRICLEKEEEYQNSDEAITETLEANEYEYTRDGKQFY